MLVALCLIIFGLSGSHHIARFMTSEAEPQIKAVVQDPARRSAALDVLKQIKQDISALDKNTANDSKALGKLVSDYASTPEQFDAAVDAALTRRTQNVEALFRGREQLMKQLEPGEWDRIVQGGEAAAQKKAKK